MIERYQTEKIKNIFSEENKLATWIKIEIIWLKHYLIFFNQEDSLLIKRLYNFLDELNLTEFKDQCLKKELITKHDVVAFLFTLEDYLGNDAQKIHIALTSSDILDTSFALLCSQANEHIITETKKLLSLIFELAQKHKSSICLGRTHGQAADINNFGHKILVHHQAINRGLTRLENAAQEIKYGKFSGAIGTYSLAPAQVEENALTELGLKAENYATQVVGRDRYSFYVLTIANLAACIEHLAHEFRLLMHGEIQELYEDFSEGQTGSSAMPHKKNPILCENICGLMRMLRSYVIPVLENQILWHERDLSHSSVERIIIPDMFNLMHFALLRMQKIIKNLHVNKEKMQYNAEKLKDTLCSQKVLLMLLNKGFSRTHAYEIVQKASFSNIGIKEYLKNHTDIFSLQEINNL